MFQEESNFIPPAEPSAPVAVEHAHIDDPRVFQSLPGVPMDASPLPFGVPICIEALPRLAEWQLFEARRRLELLRTAKVLKAQDRTNAELERDLGVPRSNLRRYTMLLAKAKLRVDSTDEVALLHALAPGISTGRPCVWAELLQRETVARALQELYLATLKSSHASRASDRRTGSIALTLERFADHSECPVTLAAKLRGGYQPSPFVRFLKSITPEQEARVRGEKHFQLHGPSGTRDMTVAGPDGQRYAMPAGYMVEFDDMSINQPFYVEQPDGTVTISRQGLYARDLASGRWLGHELIARPREAYRAADILRFLRRLILQYGKPRVIRLEQGIWKARAIEGFRITEKGTIEIEQWERPAADPAERQLLQDGISAIGVEIEYVHSSKLKGSIEKAFDYLQAVTATMTAEFINIGRHAGEIECGARAMRRVRADSHTPEAVGLAPQHILADRIAEAQAWVNRRAVHGTSADDLWDADQAKHPRAQLTPYDLAVFLPEQRTLLLRDGAVRPEVDGRVIDFRAPDLFADLGDGYKLAIRFDPDEPTLGAAIYNREQGHRNHLHFADGQLIGWAAWAPPGSQYTTKDERLVAGLEPVDMRAYGDNPDAGRRMLNDQKRNVRTAARFLPRPGQPVTRVNEVRDGRGNVARAESGMPQLETPTPAAPRQAIRSLPAARALSRDERARLHEQLAREEEELAAMKF